MSLLYKLIFPHTLLEFHFWDAVASIGGSLIGGLFGKKSASSAKDASIQAAQIGKEGAIEATKLANEAQIASAREQMAFQEKMSSTAHQRQIKDLRDAGLNPILSAKYGGASTPSGAMAPIQSAAAAHTQAAGQTAQAHQTYGTQMQSLFTNSAKSFADATSGLQNLSKSAEIDQNINNLKATYKLTEGQTKNLIPMAEMLDAQAYMMLEQANLANANTAKSRTENRLSELKEIQSNIVTSFFSDYPLILVAKELGVDGGTAVDLVIDLVGGILNINKFNKLLGTKGKAFGLKQKILNQKR